MLDMIIFLASILFYALWVLIARKKGKSGIIQWSGGFLATTVLASSISSAITSQAQTTMIDNDEVDQLIQTYNNFASKIDGMKKLPPKSEMENGAESDNFKTLQYYVLPNAVVNIDIDKKSGKTSAMGITSTSETKLDELALFNVRSLVGATMFGQSTEAGELEKLCLDIYATGHPGALSKSVKNMTVSCGNSKGIWIALISKSH